MLNENFQAGFNGATTTAKYMNGNATNSDLLLRQLYNVSSNSHYGGTGNGGYHVMIGAGDTAPIRSEYDLADASIMADNKMKSLMQTASWQKTTGAVATTQWQNNSNEPITVKEVALGFKNIGGSGSAYSKGANVMVARKVLTTPVTIQPGEIYAFSYGISI